MGQAISEVVPVLILPGIESIFSRVATVGLRFAFVLQSGLKSRDVFITAGQGLHKVKAFAVPCPRWAGLGVQQSLGGDTAEPKFG